MGGGNGQKSAKVICFGAHRSLAVPHAHFFLYRLEKKLKPRWILLEVIPYSLHNQNLISPRFLLLTSFPAGSQLKSNAAALNKVCAICKVKRSTIFLRFFFKTR
jgi:hypothetical protein